MATFELSALGVSAVDVATVKHDVLQHVKQSKQDTLSNEMALINSEISELSYGFTLKNMHFRTKVYFQQNGPLQIMFKIL